MRLHPGRAGQIQHLVMPQDLCSASEKTLAKNKDSPTTTRGGGGGGMFRI